jgi:hypothetical protein
MLRPGTPNEQVNRSQTFRRPFAQSEPDATRGAKEINKSQTSEVKIHLSSPSVQKVYLNGRLFRWRDWPLVTTCQGRASLGDPPPRSRHERDSLHALRHSGTPALRTNITPIRSLQAILDSSQPVLDPLTSPKNTTTISIVHCGVQ